MPSPNPGHQSQFSVKIEGQQKAPKKLPVRASTSTQPEEQASGSLQVPSRSSVLPPLPPGRKTRTAQKAARPITPCSSPPTHPSSSSPSPPVTIPPTQPGQAIYGHDVPILDIPIPTISQLRDFPNLTTLFLQTQEQVLVTLPNSAPSSPIPIPYSYLDIQPGNPVTPSNSPSQVSVILSILFG